jgi:hypothetical protein
MVLLACLAPNTQHLLHMPAYLFSYALHLLPCPPLTLCWQPCPCPQPTHCIPDDVLSWTVAATCCSEQLHPSTESTRGTPSTGVAHHSSNFATTTPQNPPGVHLLPVLSTTHMNFSHPHRIHHIPCIPSAFIVLYPALHSPPSCWLQAPAFSLLGSYLLAYSSCVPQVSPSSDLHTIHGFQVGNPACQPQVQHRCDYK